MVLQDTTLLCLVFYLGQRIQAQEGDFPIPTISAAPSSVVPWNGSVRILCGGTPESFLYQLWFVSENSTHRVVEKKLGFQKDAELILHRMNAATAGCYECQYRKKQLWSEHREPLKLVVTGLYDKPVLATDQSLVATLGENISFQCGSADIPFDGFSLAKEGDSSLSQYQHVGRQGNFTVGPMNPNFTGNYRCYGWHSIRPYIWSAPSDALKLVLADSRNQHHTTENLIRIGMAGMVLVLLLAILAENWSSHEASSKEGWKAVAAQSWNKQNCQT